MGVRLTLSPYMQRLRTTTYTMVRMSKTIIIAANITKVHTVSYDNN